MNSRTTGELITPVSLIDDLRSELTPILMEAGKSFDRLRHTFLVAIQNNPDLLECSPESIRREIAKCATDGLMPDNKEAAMIPYKREAQYQPMVMGIIKRVKELGGVFSIVCNLVHEHDEFVLDEADPDTLSHKSDPFSKNRGPVVGGYAIFRDDRKRVLHLETMSLEDFERVRKASKAPNSPAWNNWWEEMCRKAVLRRGSKYITLNNDKIRTLIERQDAMFDFGQPAARERLNPFTGDLIDSESGGQSSLPAPTDHAINGTSDLTGDGQAVDHGEPARQEQKPTQQRKAAQTPAEEKKPAPPPQVPAVSIEHADKAKILEGVTKLLAIGLDQSVTPKERQEQLKMAAPDWKKAVPDYAHPLMKACIDMTQWALLQQANGAPWAGDHAAFVHTVKSLLEVKTLSIGKYP